MTRSNPFPILGCLCIALSTVCSCSGSNRRSNQSSTQVSVDTDVDPILLSAIGGEVGGPEWNSLAKKYRMRMEVLKADDALVSSANGIWIFSQEHRIWRIILSVNPTPSSSFSAPYSKSLPLGIRPNDGPEDVIRKLGRPEGDDPQRPEDRWVRFRRNDILYVFAFQGSVLDSVFIEAYPGPGRL